MAQGGAALGGGGAGPTSGGGGAGGGGGQAVAEAECDELPDCKLVDDCCRCVAIPAGNADPPCAVSECAETKCGELGYDPSSLTCVAHQCSAGYDCDETQVICDQIPPMCQPGWTASVEGDCWGPCVPADECAFVSDCAQCGEGLYACVHTSIGPMERRNCVPLPLECGGIGSPPTCVCMGEAVCGGIPCSEANGELFCDTQ
ncbi:MAG: hypothetical protein IPM79_30390 [Polyangiaceae bacterium]|nr:hypothetical protein [Polyangiaceae bacterium]